jgi:hypothetical protein
MKMDMKAMCEKVNIQLEDLKLFLHEQGMDRLAHFVKLSFKITTLKYEKWLNLILHKI